jgi:Ca2+-binding RTX toxin-like protein
MSRRRSGRSFSVRSWARLVVPAALLGVGAMTMQANATSPEIDYLKTQVASFLGVADDLAAFEEMADKLPFSDFDPDDVLQLTRLLDDTGSPDDADLESLTEKLLASGADTGADALRSRLDGLDGDYDVCPGSTTCNVRVDVSGPLAGTSDPVVVTDHDSSSTTPNVIDVIFELEISRTASTPSFALADPRFAFSGGGIGPVTYTLSSSVLHFQLDKTRFADPGTRPSSFALRSLPTNPVPEDRRSAPRLAFAAKTTPGTPATIGPFAASFGFADVTVGGTLALDATIAATLKDSAALSDMRLTAEEWSTTALADLLDVAPVANTATSPAATATITVDTPLVSGTPDATFTCTKAQVDLTLPSCPTPSLGRLPDFKNFGPQDALRAAERLVSWLRSLQESGALDDDIPFVKGATDGARGALSDAIAIADRIADAVHDVTGDDPATTDVDESEDLTKDDDPATPANEDEEPRFDSVGELEEMLEDLLGFGDTDSEPDDDRIDITYAQPSDGGTPSNPADDLPARLLFQLNLFGLGSRSVKLDFGNVDALQAIDVKTGGTVDLKGRYDLALGVGFDLSPQPTEGPNGGIGSCADGEDNDNDSTPSATNPSIDAGDSDCAGFRTIEQRVFVDVGKTAGTPELQAGMSVVASNVAANARIGLLEAGVNNGFLKVGSGLKESADSAAGSCYDGVDNADDDDLADGQDPDCDLVKIDLVDPGNGLLTVQELVQLINGTTSTTGPQVTTLLDTALVGKLPVRATLGTNGAGGTLGSGDIDITGAYSGPITLGADLVDRIQVDASNFRAGELLNFSPCGNALDEDGDGKTNDGCPAVGAPQAETSCATTPEGNQDTDGDGFLNADEDRDGVVNDGCTPAVPAAGSTPEVGTACDDSGDSDGDGAVNDGCPAVDDAESSSLALHDKILIALRLLVERIEALEGGSGLVNEPLPLIGVSPKDMLSFAEELNKLYNTLATPDEENSEECADGVDNDNDGTADDGCGSPATPVVGGSAEGADCADNEDDDFDGKVNDGCPAKRATGETENVAESDCTDRPDDPSISGDQAIGLPVDDDGDGVANDGCAASVTTLQAVAGQVQRLLADQLRKLKAFDSAVTQVSDPVVNVSFEYDTAANDITFDFGIQQGLKHQSTLNADLSSVASLAGYSVAAVEGSATVAVDVLGKLNLKLGLDLDGYRPYLVGLDDATRPELQIDARAGAPDIDLAVSIGPLEASIRDGAAYLGGRFALLETTPAGQKAYFAPQSGETAPSFGTPTLTGLPRDECAAIGGAADSKEPLCAKLPLFFDANPSDSTPASPLGGPSPDNEVVITMTNLTDPGTFTVSYPGAANVLATIGDQLINVALAETGIAQLLETLEQLLNGELFGFQLPLIGDQLAEAAAFIHDLRTNLVSALARPNPLEGLTPNAEQVRAKMQEFADAVGAALNGAGILKDTNGSGGAPTAQDFMVELYCGTNEDQKCDLGGEVPPNPALDGDSDPADNCSNSSSDDGPRDNRINDGCPQEGTDGPETAGACRNGQDDDKDGVADDGCPAVGTTGPADQDPKVPESACGDGLDNDTDGTTDDGCPAIPEKTEASETDCADTASSGAPVDDDGDGKPNDGCEAKAESGAEVTAVVFKAKLGKTLASLSADTTFDIGVPGLGLASEGSITGSVYWELNLGFGISKRNGFFVDTSAPNELVVGGDIGLPNSLTGRLGFLGVSVLDGSPAQTCAAVGSMGGPCRADAGAPVDPKSRFKVEFRVNLLGGSSAPSDTRLTVDELLRSDFDDIIRFDVGARADVNLHIETTVDVGNADNAAMPKLIGDLHLDWGFNATTASSGSALQSTVDGGACPAWPTTPAGAPFPPANCFGISLDNVHLDAGTFVSELLVPIVRDIQRFTKPLEPPIKVLNTPIPVLSDLAGSPITLLKLAEIYGGADNRVGLIVSLVKIVDFVNSINVPPAGSNANFTIPIGDGDFKLAGKSLQAGELPGTDAQKAFDPSENIQAIGSLLGSLDGKIAEHTGKPISTGQTPNLGGGASNPASIASQGLSFPFLEQPAKLLGLLFGQDVDLVLYQPPDLRASFSYSQKFGPIWAVPPVFIEFGGSATITGNFGIGYDTQGLREILFEGAGPEALLHGVFLADTKNGQDVNELDFRGEIFANAQVSVLIFSAGAEGGVALGIRIDLQDPNSDGKLKFEEIASIIRRTGNPLCIFKFAADLSVFVRVFAEVDLLFWSQRWTQTLAEVTLFSVNLACDINKVVEPVLATDIDPDGTGPEDHALRLNIGPHKDARGADSLGITETKEKFTVTQEQDGSLTVVGLGTLKNFAAPSGGWDRVIADGGSDTDEITMLDGVKGAEFGTQCTNATDDDGDGKVNDGCPKLGDGPAGVAEKGSQCDDAVDGETKAQDGSIVTDGFVNDGCPAFGDVSTVSFTIPTTLSGGAAKDKVTGGNGPDTINGGAGDDTLVAREGDNSVTGGAGKDSIRTGDGADKVYQTDDDDKDTINTGLGGDYIEGGPGEDVIVGGLSKLAQPAPTGGAPGAAQPGAADIKDTIHGGPGKDDIDAGDGDDVVYGGADADNILGGKGDDDIYGNGSSATLDGGAGTETNTCTGTPVGDVITGGPGSDDIYGGDGADIVIGGSLISGQPDGADTHLHGDAGCDVILGDNATFADPANRTSFTLVDPAIGGGDTIDGGSEADVIHGQKGNDIITAQAGDDQVFGEDGDDTIDAGDGLDLVLGHAGDDNLVGGDGDDRIDGADGVDVILGDRGSINRSGTAQDIRDDVLTLGTGTGADTIRGGLLADRIHGQAGTDTIYGDSGDDILNGGDAVDTMYGGVGDDLMFGNDGGDKVFGDGGADRIIGGSDTAAATDDGEDQLFGRGENDLIAGDNASITAAGVVTLLGQDDEGDGDRIYGDDGVDRLFGGLGNDTVLGGLQDDYLEGNNGADTLKGESGQDDIVGGSSAGSDGDSTNASHPDGADIIDGGGSPDYVAGDNATITRAGAAAPDGALGRTVLLADLDSTDATLAGGDTIAGDLAGDRVLGQGGIDTVHGDDGDDYVEGNGGADQLYGDAGQDDLIGGTSTTYDGTGSGSHPDGADVIRGGNGSGGVSVNDHDVIAGDNATVTRRAGTGGWATEDPQPSRGITGLVLRDITLHDVATVDAAAPAGTSAGDTLTGENGLDVIYGQGGADTAHGGAGDDYLEGNEGQDTLHGDGDNDDVVGGTGLINDDVLVQPDGTIGTPGRLDSGELQMTGGEGFDVLAGDNGIIRRKRVNGVWVTTPNGDIQHEQIYLVDVDSADSDSVSGGDVIRGNADADSIYGQGGADTIHAGTGHDYAEGNAGVDAMHGEDGDDDLVGGTGLINGDVLVKPNGTIGTPGRQDAGESVMLGGNGYDVMAGDNAVLRKSMTDTGAWQPNSFNAGLARERVYLVDINAPASAGVAGGDVMDGGAADDVMYGQAGDDQVHGAAGEDYLEGNADRDQVYGDAGQDDIVGGTGLVGNDPAEGRDGRLDDADELFGESDTSEGEADGSGGDYIVGDNAVITRPLKDGTVWQEQAANGVTYRVHTLRDEEAVSAAQVPDTLHGGDVIYGNDNDDVVYGQGGQDRIFGGAGDDHLVGNADADVIHGNGEQDDMLGGNEVAGQHDTRDELYGDTGDDFQLGDNGLIVRVDSFDQPWTYYTEYNPDTVRRRTIRFDVGGPAGSAGGDHIQGDAGEDYQWGQDGNDEMYGNAGHDNQLGELGDDTMFGGTGEDAMVGDRGVVTNTLLDGDGRRVTADTQGPAFFKYTGLVSGQRDRRVELKIPDAGNPAERMGIVDGGADRMRGGPGHDSIHGAYGDDLINGDSGGDWVFGADGADVMWGGAGCRPGTDVAADCVTAISRGDGDRYVDYLFGGHGGTTTDEVRNSDFLDYQPRGSATNCAPGTTSVTTGTGKTAVTIDPCAWHAMVAGYDLPHEAGQAEAAQWHQGIDWIYGGWDRDVLQGDVGKNGPDFGDRLIDWKGAYNLYTRCNASYGDDGDIRQQSPAMFSFLETLAYGSGAGSSLADVRTPGTSGYRELGLAYHGGNNNGSAYPGTPGHFQDIACQPGPAKVG